MTAAALQFGPEWMRKAPASTPTSTVPPGTVRAVTGAPSASPATNTGTLPSHLQSQMQDSEGRSSSYSSILSDFGQGPVTPVVSTDDEGGRPFRYSKEQMVSVWREGGGRGDLPIDVERWEGVTQEEGREPEAVREWNDEERRFFTGPVNSEPPRRRADTIGSLNSPAEGPRERRETFSRLAGGQSSPMRERFGTTGALGSGMPGRRRRDDAPGDPPPVRQRQLSFTGQPPPSSANPLTPGAAGGRRPMGTFDGVLGREGGREEGVWGRRKLADSGGGVNGAPLGDKKRSFTGQASGEGTGNATVAWSIGGVTSQASRASGDDIDLPPDDVHSHSPDAYHHPSFEPNPGMGMSDSPEPAFHGDLNGIAAGVGAVSISDDYPGSTLAMESTRNAPGFQPTRSTSTSSLTPENVRWYYKDPTGLIQGPFPATTMQEWYEGSYFPDDLLLRREAEDTLEPLYEIKRRTGPVAKLFLSHIPPRVPPNLSQMPAQPSVHQRPPPMQSQVAFEPLSSSPFGGSYNGRDLYSPSSVVTQSTSSLLPQRQSSLDTYSSMSSGNPSSVHQVPLDSLYPLESSVPYGVVRPGVSPSDRDRVRHRESEDHLRSREPLMSQQLGVSPGSPFSRGGFTNGNVGGYQQAFDQSPGSGSLPHSLSERSAMAQLANQQPYLTPLSMGNFSSRLPTASQGNTPIDSSHSFSIQQLPQPQSSPWTTAQPQQHYQPLSQVQHQFDPAFVASSPTALGPRSPMFEMSRQSQGQQQYGQAITFGQSEQPMQHSAWQSQAFQPAQPDDWPRSAHPQNQPSTFSSMEPAPGAPTFVGDGTSERLQGAPVGMGPQAPTTSFEPEPSHAEPHSIASTKPQPIARPRADSAIQQQRQANLVIDIPPLAESGVESAVAELPRSAIPAAQPASLAPLVSVPASATTGSGPKPSPWATTITPSADERPKPTQTTSLRQIQESEARRAELRKAAERAERAKRATAAPATAASDEPSTPVTQSWGLAAPSVSSRSAAPSAEAPPSATTPWSKAGPAPKKTLKEIQEEEERQKSQGVLAAAAREGAAAAAGNVKRYADSAKTATSANVGGAWSTVGAGGKVLQSGTTALPARPAAASVPIVAARVSGSAPAQAGTPAVPRTASASSVQKAAKPASSTASDSETAALLPSAEFVSWLRDSLKGLNPGVNVDEYMQMLLSFPLDPSPSVVEIIQDSIYASSSTLDGRRFAVEFISKRKADAAARKAAGVTTSSGSGKTSLADVVKLQPKPAASEWAYKTVVKKKGKGKN